MCCSILLGNTRRQKVFLTSILLAALISSFTVAQVSVEGEARSWVANFPLDFQEHNFRPGALTDARNSSEVVKEFEQFTDNLLARTDGFTDGEHVDAAEHYFWGQRDGLAMELGALDGSHGTRSMTFEFEAALGWHRILVEGDPVYRNDLIKNSPKSFSVSAAICGYHGKVHFHPKPYVGGILEFMSHDFMKEYHPNIFQAGTPPGNVTSVDFSHFPTVKLVDCIPLSTIFHVAHVKHVNFFILDVEGGEFEVIQSIDWDMVKFDVLCIETEPSNRPDGYAEKITAFLEGRGYINHSGQQGRNIWYTRKGFTPQPRPGIDPKCFNGQRKAYNADQTWLDKSTPPFKRCQIS